MTCRTPGCTTEPGTLAKPERPRLATGPFGLWGWNLAGGEAPRLVRPKDKDAERQRGTDLAGAGAPVTGQHAALDEGRGDGAEATAVHRAGARVI
jgi:hypothetical protein